MFFIYLLALKLPGEYCQQHSDCNSFTVHLNPCSAVCPIDAECGGGNKTNNCCVYIKQNQKCNGVMCEPGFECIDSKCTSSLFPESNIGVSLCIISSVLSNLGLNLQKNKNFWCLGWLIWLISNVFNFYSLSFAAESLLASVGSLCIIFNAIFARILNQELLQRTDYASIAFIFVGSMIIVTCSNFSPKQYTLCSLLSFYNRTSMICYLIFVFLVCVFLGLMIHLVEKKQKKFFLYPLSYGIISGLLVGITTMLAKSATELFNANNTSYYQTYLILLAFVITACVQLFYLNRGLKKLEGLLQLPVFYSLSTISGVVTGGIYFDDFSAFSKSQMCLFLLGVGFNIIGVFFTIFRLKTPEEEPLLN